MTDLKTKAEKMNDHFVGISNIQGPDDPIPEVEEYSDNMQILEDVEVMEDEVKSAIKNLKINSAPGPDGVTNLALTRTSTYMAPYLTKFFNRSLKESYIPSIWKRANVTPIHKGGPTSNVKNYRPISLLSCPSKLLERVVCDKLVKFLEEEKFFGDQQFGFRKGSSTNDQILELYHGMMRSLEDHKVTKMLYIDVSKAFDRVWRKALVHKLKKAGIRGN